MILADLFDKLSQEHFQHPDSGNLFFPAYIYTYEPSKEYQIREELPILAQRLIRPNINQECMLINIFDEFISYLKSETLAGESYFDSFTQQEREEDVSEAHRNLSSIADSKEFLKYIDSKIVHHFNLPSPKKKVYVLVHGFGSIFPFLRASEFLKRFEEFVSGGGYKIVILYPGKYENNHFFLFNEINNENIYRASLLNN